MISDMDVAVRLIIAVILGGIIGYERQSNNKAAGLRTHILVCVGSCLIMILSRSIYDTVQGLTNADPTRLAAQVVNGIGFLGAGTIMKKESTVEGLTTAASIWVVSGVGLAIGSGYYLGALITTGVVFLTLSTLFRLEKKVNPRNELGMVVSLVNIPGQLARICSFLGSRNIHIRTIKLEDKEDVLQMIAVIRMPKGIESSMVIDSLSQFEGVLDVKVGKK